MIISTPLFHNRQKLHHKKAIWIVTILFVACFAFCSCTKDNTLKPTGVDYTEHQFQNKAGEDIFDFGKLNAFPLFEKTVNGLEKSLSKEDIESLLSYLKTETFQSISLTSGLIDNLPKSEYRFYNNKETFISITFYKLNETTCIIASPSLDHYFNPSQAYTINYRDSFF